MQLERGIGIIGLWSSSEAWRTFVQRLLVRGVTGRSIWSTRESCIPCKVWCRIGGGATRRRIRSTWKGRTPSRAWYGMRSGESRIGSMVWHGPWVAWSATAWKAKRHSLYERATEWRDGLPSPQQDRTFIPYGAAIRYTLWTLFMHCLLIMPRQDITYEQSTDGIPLV